MKKTILFSAVSFILGAILYGGTIVNAAACAGVYTGGTGICYPNIPKAHTVLLGNDSGSISTTSPSTAGYVLTSNGMNADPTFQAATGGGTGLSTTSPISGSNLLVYSASGAGSAYGVATSTLTPSSPLTGSFTHVGSGSLGIQVANTSQNGYLSSTDWNTFNGKQGAVTLTTTGTSGAATFTGDTLNIPQYAGTTYSAGTGLTLTGSTFSVNTSQNISTLSNLTSNGLIKTSGGTGALSIATAGTDYAPATSGSSILYGNGSGGFSNVTIGSNLTFSGGTLSASGSGSVGTLSTETPIGTINGTNTVFTVSNVPALLELNGSYMTSGSDYTLTGAGPYTITFVNAPASGSNLVSLYGNAASINSFTYPLVDTSNVVSLAFGTTTSNTWAGTQTFTNAISGSVTGNSGTATKLATPRTIAGVAFDGSANISLNNNAITNGAGYTTNTGTVTSVDMTVPTGLSISGNPVTTSGTLALSLAAGYTIPLIASTTDWNTAYLNRITSLTTTGTSGAATLTGNVLNIPQYSGGGSSASSTLLSDNNTFSGSNIFSATTTLSTALQLGGTAADHMLTLTAPRTYSASVSVGGLMNLTNTLNNGAGLVLYTNHAGSATGRLLEANCANAAFDQDCVHVDVSGVADGLSITGSATASNALSITHAGVDHAVSIAYTGTTANKGALNLTSTNTTGSVFQVAGAPAGLGIVKIQSSGAGDVNGATLSLDASLSGYLGQAFFAKCGSATNCYTITNSSSATIMRLLSSGMMGIGTTPSYNLDIAGNGHLTGLLDADHFVATSTTATSTFGHGLDIASGCFAIAGTCIGGGGGGGTPGGSNTQLQFNNSGAFGGANLYYITASGNLGIGTSSPLENFTLGSTTSALAYEYQYATSTSMNIGMASTSNGIIGLGTSATTLTVSTYNSYPGQKQTVTTCSPGATAGALTWVNVHYSGGIQPGNTTTANQCDMWYLQTIAGTSTPIVVLTGMTPGIQ